MIERLQNNLFMYIMTAILVVIPAITILAIEYIIASQVQNTQTLIILSLSIGIIFLTVYIMTFEEELLKHVFKQYREKLKLVLNIISSIICAQCLLYTFNDVKFVIIPISVYCGYLCITIVLFITYLRSPQSSLSDKYYS